MKKAISLLLVFIFILTSAVSLAGCSKGPFDEIKSTKDELKVVGTAGGYEILYEELRCLTLGFKEQMEWTYGDGIWDTEESAEKYRAELEASVTFALAVNSAALKLAADNGIKPDDKEVEEYVELKLAEQASEISTELAMQSDEEDYSPSRKEINDAYKAFLEENYLTDHYYRYVLSIDACIELLKQKFVKEGTLSSDDDAVTKYINENFVRTVHVYVPFGENSDKAKETAELVEWILKNNFKFESKQAELKEKLGITAQTESGTPVLNLCNRIINAETVSEKMKILIGSSYNKDMTITQNGYYFSYGEFDEAYEKAAMGLAVDEVSSVITTESGYYVIERLALDENYVMLNLDTLKSQYHTAYINKLIEKEQADISFAFNDYGKTLDLTKIKE